VAITCPGESLHKVFVKKHFASGSRLLYPDPDHPFETARTLNNLWKTALGRGTATTFVTEHLSKHFTHGLPWSGSLPFLFWHNRTLLNFLWYLFDVWRSEFSPLSLLKALLVSWMETWFFQIGENVLNAEKQSDLQRRTKYTLRQSFPLPAYVYHIYSTGWSWTWLLKIRYNNTYELI